MRQLVRPTEFEPYDIVFSTNESVMGIVLYENRLLNDEFLDLWCYCCDVEVVAWAGCAVGCGVVAYV